MGPTSVKLEPPLFEKAAPLKLWPPPLKNPVSNTLPESLKPATTLFPHRAVDLSLWVNPAKEEKPKSVAGLETARTHPKRCGVNPDRLGRVAGFFIICAARLSQPLAI